jgi:hypothetical protein
VLVYRTYYQYTLLLGYGLWSIRLFLGHFWLESSSPGIVTQFCFVPVCIYLE